MAYLCSVVQFAASAEPPPRSGRQRQRHRLTPARTRGPGSQTRSGAPCHQARTQTAVQDIARSDGRILSWPAAELDPARLNAQVTIARVVLMIGNAGMPEAPHHERERRAMLDRLDKVRRDAGAHRAAAKLQRWADVFPYVNGGLFSGRLDVPRFSRTARSYLLHIGGLGWTKINPDIFGSMIQAVAKDDERGAACTTPACRTS
jgi:hypothetical protein